MSSVSHEEIAKLHALTLKARNLSYSPYSKFRVGACILDTLGNYFQGANVENAAYSGLCAERTALVKAITSGTSSRQFKAIGIAADTVEICPPCGNCRQFLREFSEDMKIFMFTEAGQIVETDLAKLLPLSFGPDSLIQLREGDM